MIILGIDPGTTKIGFGIIRKEKNKISCLHYGIISQPSPFLVTNEIFKLIDEYTPEIASVEKLFFFKNQKTVIPVSEMRGAILAALAINNVPVQEFTPLQVKQAVSGYGRSDKKQIAKMVRFILRLKEEIKSDDAADGLAIAICCANTIVY